MDCRAPAALAMTGWPSGATLTVPPGWTLDTNSNTLTSYGTIYSGGGSYGAVTVAEPETPEDAE